MIKEIIRRLVPIVLVPAAVLLAVSACGKKEEVPQADPGSLQAVFFDVGKGDCILLSMGDSHVLLDAGYEETAEKILKELRARGIDAFDAMIITHYDKDHVGGAAEIAQEIPVAAFYLPDYIGDEDKCGDLLDLIREKDLPSTRVSSDTELVLGDAALQIHAGLVPYDPEEKNDNDASLIVEIRCGEDEWLLPGDIERDAIDVWLSSEEKTYDILKLPHHGKKEKNSDELIEAVSPSIAVITDSAGDEAAPKVLKNLEKNRVEVYRSSMNGTITITGGGDEQYQVTVEH